MKDLAKIDREITRHCFRNYKMKYDGEHKYDQDFQNYQSEGIGKRIKKSMKKGADHA